MIGVVVETRPRASWWRSGPSMAFHCGYVDMMQLRARRCSPRSGARDDSWAASRRRRYTGPIRAARGCTPSRPRSRTTCTSIPLCGDDRREGVEVRLHLGALLVHAARRVDGDDDVRRLELRIRRRGERRARSVHVDRPAGAARARRRREPPPPTPVPVAVARAGRRRAAADARAALRGVVLLGLRYRPGSAWNW